MPSPGEHDVSVRMLTENHREAMRRCGLLPSSGEGAVDPVEQASQIIAEAIHREGRVLTANEVAKELQRANLLSLSGGEGLTREEAERLLRETATGRHTGPPISDQQLLNIRAKLRASLGAGEGPDNG